MKAELLVVGLFVLAGCGESPTAPSPVASPPAPVTRAVVTVSARPNPIVADADGGGFVAGTTVVVTETGGVAGAVDYINVTLRHEPGGIVGTVNFGSDYVIANAGTNRVAANGALPVPGIAFRYSGPRDAIVTIAVQFRDDHGRLFYKVATVPVI
jgi:hypothetical protein